MNLGWKLALTLAGAAPAAILDTYGPERAPVGRAVLRFTDRAFAVASSSHPLVRFLRTEVAPRLLPVVLGFRAGRRLGFRVVSQLAIRYRGGVLAVTGPGVPRGGLRAGDRLPDAEIVLGGRPTSLHALIAAPGWHLLLCGPGWESSPAPRLAAGRALTVHRLVADGRGGRSTALRGPAVSSRRATQLLVRPDGHVGYRGAGTELTRLGIYLDRWLPRS